MFPLFSIIIQTLLAATAFFIAWKASVSAKKTGDKAFQSFVWCFSFAGAHILLYVIGIIHFSLYSNEKILLLLLILSRILLYCGILFFMQSPIFMVLPFIKKHNRAIVVSLGLLIVCFSILHFISSPNPFVSENGVVLENIQDLWIALLIILLPVGSSIVWIFSLIKNLPKNASAFFTGKVIFLCFGIIFAALGNSVYILAKSTTQSITGVGIVVLGYLFLALALSMSDIRSIFLKP